MFEGAREAYESVLTNTDHRHTLAMQLPLCKEYIYVLKVQQWAVVGGVVGYVGGAVGYIGGVVEGVV